ncbi:35357_t:CDS:2 [Gigaspora margarita]|uniref:35357_t:CDS:1 n=1 Tax=Gigaspora margarita TaxID=4874 RepID=A0ABN7URP8_GIGMA|nr:35357_t:CDS:2 [Gigaspora margarita]
MAYTEEQLEQQRQRKRQQQKQHLQERTIINELTIVPSYLGLLTICVHCEAKKFKGKLSGFCCNNGNVKLADTEALVALQDLFVKIDKIGYDFHNNIRAYNNLFAFTSMGVHLNQHFANGKDSVYTFRVQGGVYHAIGSLLPPIENSPKYLHLYVYNTEHEINNQLQIMPNLCRDTIELLKNILDEVNPFVANFRYLSILENIANYKLIIKADHRLDQRTYNAPTASQVAAIWVESSNPSEFLSNKDNKKTMLTEYFHLNATDLEARNYTYSEIPRATSFEDLKYINGYLCHNFKESAQRKNLLEADRSLHECMFDAKQFRSPYTLCNLFSTILVFGEPTDV